MTTKKSLSVNCAGVVFFVFYWVKINAGGIVSTLYIETLLK